MKQSVLLLVFTLCANLVVGQDGKLYFEKGLELAKAGDYSAAIENFNRSIEADSTIWSPWHYRGLMNLFLSRDEEALADFDRSIMLEPDYDVTYFNRGKVKENLTDYDGAIEDYSTAIKFDPQNGEAYYARGVLLQVLNRKEEACEDFDKALELEYERAKIRSSDCADSSDNSHDYNPILYLTEVAESKKYGYDSENPVRVGAGPAGGTGNQHRYLRLLRDAQGMPVEYNRLGSCCSYESENSPFGLALLDEYEVKYMDEKGKLQVVSLFLSFYDYEPPKIPIGFSTVKRNN